MKSPVKHVELLDYLRGIAIIAVLLLHTFSNAFGYDELPWGSWFRQFSVPDSFLCLLPINVLLAGVPIFFVVSGFCIHMSFQRQGQNWGQFFIRRFFRIYPAYLAALIFVILLLMGYARQNALGQGDGMQLLTHLFLIHNCGPATFSGISASFWSLAVEAQLYLLYPALLGLVARLGWRPAMVMLAGCELLIRGVDGLIQTAGATDTTAGHISWWFAASPLGYWFSWALGAFIADAFLKNQPLPFVKTSPVWWIALAILSYFVKPLYPLRFLLFAVVTAVVASRLLSRARPEIKVPSLSLKVLGKIGLWSYSIYLLHQPLLNIFSHAIDWVVPAEYHSVPMAFSFDAVLWLAIISLSFLWYKLFELPGIALGKRIISKLNIRNGGVVEPVKATVLPPPRIAIGRTSLATVGGYCLMSATLLVIVGGSFLGAAKLAPRSPWENNNLAWSLATSPEATNRNGALAVKLAEDACRRTNYRVTLMVGTLAAAYAEAGRFDEAISTAQRASLMAVKDGETNLFQRNQELLELYQNHQAYHEP